MNTKSVSTVYIDRKGIDLDHQAGVALLRAGDERLGTVPLAAVDRLVVRGVNFISTRLLAELWSRRIGLVLLGGRKNDVMAMLVGPGHADATIRLGQYALHQDENERIRRSRHLIASKMKAQLRLLRRALEARADCRHRLLAASVTIEGIRGRLEHEPDPSLNQILGLEGAAAAAYYEGLAELFPPSLGFHGRNRRPPRDPVNACLSLGYTLLHFEAVREAHAAGLDPLLGFFHQPLAGRESLACDLVEPLRPRIDGWVWALFRDRVLRSSHFTEANGACLIGKVGRQNFYQAYEEMAPPLRRLLRLSCRALVRDVRAKASAGPS